MSLSSKFRIKFSQVIFLSILWTIFGILSVLYNHTIFIDENVTYVDENYSLLLTLVINSVFPFIAGLTAGSIVIFFFKDKFRDKPSAISILYNSLFYIFFIFIVNVIGAYFYNLAFYGRNFTDPLILERTKEYLTSISFVRSMAYWFLVVSFSSSFLQIIDKYGQNFFWYFMLGKYHKPREEKRIFMFIDMKSSTAIAEKLKHLQFFRFLNEFYKDITDAIIYNEGEIYEYVGDEVVISWKTEKGIQNANCIRCFFHCKKAIDDLSDKYMEKFGVIPEFKAAVNYGVVTVGEIGIIKKEIVYSGDVLNTASRIVNECRNYKTDFLASGKLVTKLDMDSEFNAEKIGEILLRGKSDATALYKITRKV